MNKKELIRNFINEVQKIQFVPEYCHNLKGAKNKVYYSGPLMDEEELTEAIDSLLFGKWFVSGEKVYQFEREFSKTVNQKYSVMVNSGSSANLVMIAALKQYFKWTSTDEILISVVGFPTTLNPIIQAGLKPVFVDIEYDTLNFDLNELVKKITPNTKAIFVSPVLGNPPDMDRLVEIAKTNNLEIIMDGCDSYGSKWNGKHLDEYAIATSCSFYPAHHITTGEGGMVSSNVEEIVKLARTFAWWGRDCYCVGPANLLKNGSCNCRFSQWIKELPYEIDHKYFFSQIGYNLKPLDLQGGIGLAQLKKADGIHEARKKNKDTIQNILSSIKGLKFPTKHDKADVSWFGVPVICESFEQKSKLVIYLETNGIQTRNYFAGNILLHPAYTHLESWKNYPNATNVLGNVFFLGSSPTLTQDNLDYMKEVIEKYENVLYMISTTHNYHVFDDIHKDVDTNLTKLLNVLQNCKDKNIVFNFVSSWFVYGDVELPAKEDGCCKPKGFYSITKRCAEDLIISYCETFKIKYRILRLCNVYGPSDGGVSKQKNALQYLINLIKSNNEINLYYDGNFVRDYMHVDDICKAIYTVLYRADYNQIINIGSGIPQNFREIIDFVIKETNSSSKITAIDAVDFHKIVQVKDMYLDVEKLNKLGFKQHIDIYQGIKTLL